MIGIKKKKRDLFGGTLRCAGLAAAAVTANAAADIVPSTNYTSNYARIFGWDAAYATVFDSGNSSLTFPATESYLGGGLDISAYSGPSLVGISTTVSDPGAWTFTWAEIRQYFTVTDTKEMLVEWDLIGWDSYVNSILQVHEIGVGVLLSEDASSSPGSTVLTLTPGNEYVFFSTMVGVAGDGGDGFGFARMSNVPAPGVLALLGLAGLCGGRRRRRE